MVTAPKQFSHILGLLSKETSKKKGLKLKKRGSKSQFNL